MQSLSYVDIVNVIIFNIIIKVQKKIEKISGYYAFQQIVVFATKVLVLYLNNKLCIKLWVFFVFYISSWVANYSAIANYVIRWLVYMTVAP